MFIFANKRTPLAVLTFLIGKGEELHVRMIARETGLSLGFISRTLRQLQKDDLISSRKRGRMLFCRVNHANAIVKQVKILVTVTELSPLLKKLVPLSRRVVLFGSAARGENTAESDFDLFIVADDPAKVRVLVRSYPRVVAIVMRSAEHVNLRKRDFALYDQIGRGITLWEKCE